MTNQDWLQPLKERIAKAPKRRTMASLIAESMARRNDPQQLFRRINQRMQLTRERLGLNLPVGAWNPRPPRRSEPVAEPEESLPLPPLNDPAKDAMQLRREERRIFGRWG